MWLTKVLLAVLGLGVVIVMIGHQSHQSWSNYLGQAMLYGTIIVAMGYLASLILQDFFTYLAFLNNRPRRHWGFLLVLIGAVGLLGEPSSQAAFTRIAAWYSGCLGLMILGWIINRIPFARKGFYIKC